MLARMGPGHRKIAKHQKVINNGRGQAGDD